MRYYILEQYIDNIAVAHIADSIEEANEELDNRESTFPDLLFWIEESNREPVCVNI